MDMENFGWEPDDNLPQSSQSRHPGAEKMMTLRLKRDRKIVNKTELTRLQRNFEACVREIQSLENSKTSKATIWALAAGVIGTAFIACSTFAVTAVPPKNPFVYYFCDSRISGMDPAVFPL